MAVPYETARSRIAMRMPFSSADTAAAMDLLAYMYQESPSYPDSTHSLLLAIGADSTFVNVGQRLTGEIPPLWASWKSGDDVYHVSDTRTSGVYKVRYRTADTLLYSLEGEFEGGSAIRLVPSELGMVRAQTDCPLLFLIMLGEAAGASYAVRAGQYLVAAGGIAALILTAKLAEEMGCIPNIWSALDVLGWDGSYTSVQRVGPGGGGGGGSWIRNSLASHESTEK